MFIEIFAALSLYSDGRIKMKKSKMSKKSYCFMMTSLLLSMLLLTACHSKETADPISVENNSTNITEVIQETGGETVDNQNNLFENAELIQSGWFYERSETQFDHAIYYKITETDASVIAKALQEASATEEAISFDKNTYQYQMYLYDEAGEQLYWLFVDSEGNIAYDEKKLIADQLQEWIDNTVSEQGK